jgi:hypothetical protein
MRYGFALLRSMSLDPIALLLPWEHVCFQSRYSVTAAVNVCEVKISLLQAMEAHRIASG